MNGSVLHEILWMQWNTKNTKQPMEDRSEIPTLFFVFLTGCHYETQTNHQSRPEETSVKQI